jgi:hypothetical protein
MSVNEQAPTSDLTKALSRLAGNRHSDGVSSIVSADDRSVIINGCYEMMVALKAPSPRAQALEEAALERSIERWRGMKPSDVMKGSTAQITYALEDARKDILTLYSALSSQPVADGAFQDRVKPWMLACFGE